MISNILAIVATFSILSVNSLPLSENQTSTQGMSIFGHTLTSPLPGLAMPKTPLAEHQFSLENRYDNAYVNDVFKDNILLNIAYLGGRVKSYDQINWDEVKKPFEYKFTLEPGQTFAYHDGVLDKYQGKVVKTTGAHFNAQEGFKSSGYLYGDGVCHLASLIYWTAKDAGLEVEAPTNHDFMKINEIPREYGVSIYAAPGQTDSEARQNLYVTNNRQNPVTFVFDHENNSLKLSAIEES
ncbi:MAG: VanW family protein [Candidatus Curtissbacteria bacterium]